MKHDARAAPGEGVFVPDLCLPRGWVVRGVLAEVVVVGVVCGGGFLFFGWVFCCVFVWVWLGFGVFGGWLLGLGGWCLCFWFFLLGCFCFGVLCGLGLVCGGVCGVCWVGCWFGGGGGGGGGVGLLLLCVLFVVFCVWFWGGLFGGVFVVGWVVLVLWW
ncbi:hypothetical protein [Pseudomonas syringae group genomosp. 7]|uniref:hypothetical protein n=1 Tax=Pseudomonas syringae group genomosp. 7 TaxID=251699 RepID=UPI00376FDCED